MPKRVEIQHDAFARRTLYRWPVGGTNVVGQLPKSCDFCGGRPGRFKYGWVGDDKSLIMPPRDGKAFCDITCARCYYDGGL